MFPSCNVHKLQVPFRQFGANFSTINAMSRRVHNANTNQNPLSYTIIGECKGDYVHYLQSKNSETISVRYMPINDIPNDIFTQMLQILTENMKDLYEKSFWGWKEDDKIKEMKEQDAKYLLLESNTHSPQLVGFCEFRFVIERGLPCIYTYEIHLLSSHRGYGIGKQLMKLLEMMGHKFGFRYSLLTCFEFSPYFLFYKKIGYKVEEEYDFDADSSDDEMDEDEEDSGDENSDGENDIESSKGIKLFIKRTTD